jgi:hypothetical protein
VTGPADEYPDGLNLYQYVSSNPIRLFDPFGLEGYEDWVDEAIADRAGNAIASLVAINTGASFALMGMHVVGDLLKFVVPGYGLYEGYEAFQNIRNGEGTVWDYVGLGLSLGSHTYYFYKAIKWIAKYKRLRKAMRLARAAVPDLRTLKFSDGALRGMSRGGRHIPRSVIDDVLTRGTRVADPQGTAGSWMYSAYVWVNGQDRYIEVLWNAAENAVWHVLLKG